MIKVRKHGLSKSNSFSFVYNILLILSILYLVNNPILRVVGGISIIIYLSLFVFLFLINIDRIEINKIWFAYIIYAAFILFSLIDNFSLTTMYRGVLQIIIILPIVYSFNLRKSSGFIKNKMSFLKIVHVGMICIVLVALFLDNRGIDIFNTISQTVLKVMLPASFFWMYKTEKKFLSTVLYFLFFIFIGERGSAVSILSAYVTYRFIGYFYKNKLRNTYKAYFIIVILLLILGVLIYINLQNTRIGDELTYLSRKYTGSNFFSGRNILWEQALEQILQKPTFGHGPGDHLFTYNEKQMSTHNTYLYILLQGGIVGLFNFLLIMYIIWDKFYKNLDSEIVKLSASYLIGILLIGFFELSLIVNAITVSMFYALIIIIGLVESNRIGDK